MKGLINKRSLFGDEYRALGLCEFQKELPIIKQLIKLAADAVKKQSTLDSCSHDGVCYMFAKSIVDYLIMAYDNFLLGHFDATQMVLRSVVENSICLNIFLSYTDHELWKYYMIQSFYEGIKIPGAKTAERNKKDFEGLCKYYEIPKEFLIKSKKNGSREAYAYIDKQYGWTYPINKNFTFSGLCNLVNPRDYSDFKLMSMYSHGTSLYLKMGGMASADSIMNMCSLFYYNIYKLVTTYCPDSASARFYQLIDKLGERFDKYIQEFEE